MLTRIPFGDCYCVWAEPNIGPYKAYIGLYWQYFGL